MINHEHIGHASRPWYFLCGSCTSDIPLSVLNVKTGAGDLTKKVIYQFDLLFIVSIFKDWHRLFIGLLLLSERARLADLMKQ